MTGPVDTGAEAVEALAASLIRSFPSKEFGGVDRAIAMGECGVDALVLLDAQATLRALAAERDALRAELDALRINHASLQKAVSAQLAAARREVWEEAARVCEAEQEKCERAASRESVRAPYDPYPYAEQGEKAGELAAALRARAEKENGDV